MPDPFENNSASPEESPPEIPDFQLIRRIGRGGFGDVWLAENRTTGHLRAVKTIPLRRGDAVDAAGREIASLIRLESKSPKHSSLLTIHHVGRTDRFLFYVMDPADDLSGSPASRDPEYRPATLENRMASSPLTPADAERFAWELLAGLASLHAAGMVHRDVKPSNCLFVGGELKLADFGLLAENDPLVSRVGTQTYMPPDGRMNAAADVYASGLVLYEMLSGFPAGDFPRLGAKAKAVVGDLRLTKLMKTALKACQPDPKNRFDDARPMLSYLKQEKTDSGVSKRTPALVAVALLAVLAFVALFFSDKQPPAAHVNFITHPFEATILLDGDLLKDAEGNPYKTPCTVENLPAGKHRLTFKLDGREDLTREDVDFAQQRQIDARW